MCVWKSRISLVQRPMSGAPKLGRGKLKTASHRRCTCRSQKRQPVAVSKAAERAYTSRMKLTGAVDGYPIIGFAEVKT